MNFRDTVILNLKNLPGRRSKRKLVVFECDDWGSIRMPSADVYQEMLRENIPVDKSIFNRFDTLADKDDLEYLFEVLLSKKDKNGHPAVITPVTNVANPDFKRIKESGFTKYFYEPFTATLKRYGRHSETFNTWKKGMELEIFIPESHGREHISVQLWLRKLRDGDHKLLTAFEKEFLSVHIEGIHPAAIQFRPEFYFDNPEQTEFLKTSISDGINLFTDIFGYIPRAFVPSNGIFHPVFEQRVAETGVRYLYVSHFNPIPDENGNIRLKYYPVDKKTTDGITYYTRNCAFEPVDPCYNGIDLTLKQIEAAFRWGKPANISTHRVNFVGGIAKSNREKGLKELNLLLATIIKIWPEAEFMSSADMFRVLYENS